MSGGGGPWWLVLGALVAVGCQGAQSAWRPFSSTGVTRIPPPPTGAFGMAESSYYTAPSSGGSARLPRAPSDTQLGGTSSLTPLDARPGGAASLAPSGTAGTGTVSPSAELSGQPARQSDGLRTSARPVELPTGTATSRPTETTASPAPLRWVDPLNTETGNQSGGTVRRNTSVLGPSPQIREPSPPSGGRTVIRLGYEEETTEPSAATTILPPKPPRSSLP
jgi:hypothetical protein